MSVGARLTIALICNLIIVIATILVVRSYCKTEDGKYSWSEGKWKFKFFTTDSNVFSALTALVMIPFEIYAIIGGNNLPPAPLVIKYIGTVSVALTFLTVLFFLGPTQGYKEMFSGTSFFMHLMGPLLAFISFCFLEEGKMSYLWIIPALLPLIAYTIVYRHMVLDRGPLNGGWEDFYGFNVKGRWKISLVLMSILMFIINFAVIWIHNH